MKRRSMLALLTILFVSSAYAEQPSRVAALADTLLNGKDTASRLEAAKLLGQSASADAVDPLIEMLGESNRAVRWGSLEALGELGRLRAVPALVDYLGRREAYRWGKILAINALAALRDPRAVPPLVRLLKETRDPIIQRSAIIALGTLGDTETVSVVMPFLTNEREWVQNAAQTALTELTAPALHGPVPNGFEEWRQWYARLQESDEQVQQ